MIEKMTPTMATQVEGLVRKICAVTEGGDEHIAASALAFCLFGTINHSLNLNQREAVEYCAKHFKAYAKKIPKSV